MILRRSSAGPDDQRLPRLAAVTMVRDEGVMLPRWVRHYTGQCGSPDALVVLDDNSVDGSTDDLPCSVIRLPPLEVKPFEPARMGLISGIAAALLNAYDAVLFADADEFLVADPCSHPSLRHLLADRSAPVLGAVTLNVVHDLAREAALDPERPVLQQRSLAKFVPLMCKPAIKRVPAPWARASHGIYAPYAVDPALFMFHLKFADRDLLRAQADHRRRMVELDGRASSTSWRHGGDDMVRLLERVNEGLDREAAKPFAPPARKLGRIVQQQPDGLFRAVGKGQSQAMEAQRFVRVPERFRDLV